MKFYNSIFYLFTLAFVLTLNSCSKDSEDDSIMEEATNLLIGEWSIESESDYFCESDVVYRELITDPNQIYNYNDDGTWQKFEDGVADEFQYGTWERISDGLYAINHLGDDVQDSVRVEFDGNNVMKFDITECRDDNGESVYNYELYQRQ